MQQQAVYPQVVTNQQGTQPAPQVIVYPQGQAEQDSVNPRFAAMAAIVLGVIQVIIGILCIVINIAVLAINHPYYPGSGIIGAGFWAGLVILIAGTFGIVSGQKKTQCPIVAFMVLSIISAVFTVGLIAQGAMGLLLPLFNYRRVHDGYDTSAESGLSLTLILLAVIELFIAIASSVICCVGMCCRSSGTQPGYVVTNAQYNAAGNQPVYIAAQGQPYVQPAGGQPMYVGQGQSQGQQPYVQPGQGYETKPGHP